MVNWLRTLLLNPITTGCQIDVPGDEVVPQDYAYITPPSIVARLQDVLLGPANDRQSQNIRLWMLLGLIHGTDLEPYALARDSRVTYWPPVDSSMYGKALLGTPSVADMWQSVLTIMTPQTENELFGTDTSGTYADLREIWQNHILFSYRFAAVVLAMAYRLDDSK